MLDFDPEGLPCDEAGGCASGYRCVEGRCVQGATCDACESWQRCERDRCVPATCAELACPAGFRCADRLEVGPTCVRVDPPGPGHRCLLDSDCRLGGSSRAVCLLGAIQDFRAGGALRGGVCVEPCEDGGTCASADAVCRSYLRGFDAGLTELCAPVAALNGCVDNASCARHGLVCTVFDHAELGVALLCDAPLDGGAAPAATCSPILRSETERLCANGLCLPLGATSGSRCVDLCLDGVCGQGESCAPVNVNVTGTVRSVPGCVSQPTLCAPCADETTCGPDAPRCTFIDQALYCLPECTPTATSGSACPVGLSCTEIPDAGYRCVVADAGCGG